MPTTVLPQLQTIEAELALQQSQLEAQLTAIREKLNGLRAVMPIFEGTADTATTTAESGDTAVERTPKATKKKAAKAKKVPTKKATAKKATTKKSPAKTTAVKKATATAKKSPAKTTAAKKATATAKKATAKKIDRRTSSWQKYTRPGVKNESIPDAVKLILETQPGNEFKIADVMTALFKEDMPKEQYLKARNRISNVLSGGVRSGDWHKGARGSYRLTAA